MKKIYKLFLLSVVTLGLASCDFDTENYQQIPTDDAYKSVQDVENGMNGAYYAAGTYRFLGNYAIAYGDFSAGVSVGNRSTGHFYNQSAWIVSDTDAELDDAWNYGFKVIDRCTRTIQGAKDVLANTALHLTEEDVAKVKSYMAQCHALKALANYYLVNLFAYPYQEGVDNLGLPLVKDTPIKEFEKIDRSTVGQTYELILSDLTNAETILDEALADGSISAPNAFYMGAMGIQALKARVAMSMGDYATAEKAAKQAIVLKGKGNGTGSDKVPSNEIYLSMWSSLAINDEDMFTIAKTEADNLSANSLNTLYGSYRATIANSTVALFNAEDIRLGLIVPQDGGGKTTSKYIGLPTSAATSNIPVFRKSEMSLIIAEVEARNNNIPEAQNYLYYTAKRDLSITSSDQLPATRDELLAFIAKERIREFAGEGHRFYDARRMGLTIQMTGFKPFDIAKFVFPIPADEINAGFCTQQNINWEKALPVK